MFHTTLRVLELVCLKICVKKKEKKRKEKIISLKFHKLVKFFFKKSTLNRINAFTTYCWLLILFDCQLPTSSVVLATNHTYTADQSSHCGLSTENVNFLATKNKVIKLNHFVYYGCILKLGKPSIINWFAVFFEFSFFYKNPHLSNL